MTSAASSSPPSDPLVLRTDHEGVAIVELNRPHRRNALIGPLFDELAQHINAISEDANVHAVLLCGAGGAFCSGLDLTEYNADPAPPWLETAADSLRQAHVALAECAAPIIVALERYAINGGAAFALAGDLIVVGQGAGRTIKTAGLALAGVTDAEAWFSRALAVAAIPGGGQFRPGSIQDA